MTLRAVAPGALALLTLFAPALLAAPARAQTVRDSVRMTPQVMAYYPTGSGPYYNCGSRVVATWPDIAPQALGRPGTYSDYQRVATEGMYVATYDGHVTTDPGRGIFVPDGHLGHGAHFGGASSPDPLVSCAGTVSGHRTLIGGIWTVLNASPYRITDWYAVLDVPNGKPIALYEWAQTTGLTVAFDGSFERRLSHEVDNTAPGNRRPVVAYAWDFGDGGTGTGDRPSHPYAEDGEYLVRLTVTDDDGEESTYEETITVEAAALRVEVTADPTEARQGDLIEVVATITNVGIVTAYNVKARQEFTVAVRIDEALNVQGSRRTSPTLTALALPSGEELVVTRLSLGAGESFEVRRWYEVEAPATYRPPGGTEYRPVESEVEWDAYLVTGEQPDGEPLQVRRPCLGWGPEGGCEDVTAIQVAGLVVNSTDDDADEDAGDGACDTGEEVNIDGEMEAECTLRAAIEEANASGGGTIRFDIPGDGVPRIDVPAETEDDALPAFAAPITLDATTQPGGWVELVGPGTELFAAPGGSGLVVGPGAGGSEVRGLVIHSFRASGLLLQEGADGCLIEGNRIGTDAAGTQAMGNGGGYRYYLGFSSAGGGVRIRSDGNTIRDNVLAGNVELSSSSSAGGVDLYLDPGASGNQVVNNAIGVGSDGEPISFPTLSSFQGLYTGVHVGGENNVIGGAPDAGNVVVGPNVGLEVVSEEGGNEVSYNVIGTEGLIETSGPDVDRNNIGIHVGLLPPVGSSPGIPVLEGNNTVIAHNLIVVNEGVMWVSGSGNEIAENTMTGQRRDIGSNIEQRHEQAAVLVNVGTGNAIRGNTITSNVSGIAVNVEIEEDLGVSISENDIHASWVGVTFAGRLGEYGNDGTSRAWITRNRIATPGSAIDFGTEAVVVNDPNDGDEGPNDLLNRPVVLLVARDGEAVTVEGFLQTPILSEPYTVEAFSNAACASLPHTRVGAVRYGPGEHFLGSIEVPVPTGGDPGFSVSLTGVPEGHRVITLTASRPDLGVTSQFSRCVPINGADQVAQADVAAGQTGEVLGAQGVAVSIPAGLHATPGGASRGGRGGGTLFVTRYETRPDTSLFADATAPAPGGSTVRPEAVAPRYWWLADRNLTPGGGADSTAAATFDVCLSAGGAVFDAALSSVVVVRRDEGTGGLWVPLPTTRSNREGVAYLCAAGLTALGELGLGGAASAFVDEPDEPGEVPEVFALSAAYPNPFNPATTLRLDLPESGHARVEVFDALGRRVVILLDGEMEAGTHTVTFDGQGLASGLYVARLVAGAQAFTQRLTLAR